MPDTPAQALPADQPPASEADETMPASREVFLYFLLLGFINVGGPVAQITMMFNQMVERRHWMSNDRFVKIMAFTHMLPGPEALQLAIYVGQRPLHSQAGRPGHHCGRHHQARPGRH